MNIGSNVILRPVETSSGINGNHQPTTSNLVTTIPSSPTAANTSQLLRSPSTLVNVPDSIPSSSSSPTTVTHVVATQDSPMSACIRQIASMPLSSPSSDNISVPISSNDTPSKRRCTMNLSQIFED